jgi:hypothetical protein
VPGDLGDKINSLTPVIYCTVDLSAPGCVSTLVVQKRGKKVKIATVTVPSFESGAQTVFPRAIWLCQRGLDGDQDALSTRLIARRVRMKEDCGHESPALAFGQSCDRDILHPDKPMIVLTLQGRLRRALTETRQLRVVSLPNHC